MRSLRYRHSGGFSEWRLSTRLGHSNCHAAMAGLGQVLPILATSARTVVNPICSGCLS
jgi:hypothetical protein